MGAGRIEGNQIGGNVLYRTADPGLGSFPVLAAKRVDLGLFGICAGIFLQHIQRGRLHVQAAPLGVLDLDIILDGVVDLDLLDAPVDSHAVALVDHIVADGQLGKAVQLLPAALHPALLFLLLAAKDVRLCDQHKLLHGILEAPAGVAVGDHDLPGTQRALGILAEKGIQTLIQQLLRQTAAPGPRCSQQDDPAALFLPGLQILDQHRELVVVGIDGTGDHRIPAGDLQLAGLLLHQVQCRTALPGQIGGQPHVRDHPSGLLRPDLAVLQTVLHRLPVLLKDHPGIFHDPGRLVQKDHTVLRQVVQEGIRQLAEEFFVLFFCLFCL